MIERFLTYLRCELNYSAHTVRAYEHDLLLLARFLNGEEATEFDPAAVTLSDLRAWISEQASRGLTARTLRRRTLAARTLFHFLRRAGLLERNPAADLPLPRLPAPLPAFVREEDMERILDEQTLDTECFEEVRDRFIIEFLYSTGLRRAELLSLRDADVDTSKGEVKVTGKRNKQRLVPLPPELCEHVERYRRLRDARFAETPEAFLLADSGRAMNNEALSRIVKIQLSSANVSRKTPHVLRHTFATAMVRHEARLDSVKELLGHSSLATTQIYTHLSFRELQQNYQLAHPRAAKK